MHNVPFLVTNGLDMSKPKNKQDWQDVTSILIAYYMAKRYKEDIRQKVVNTCAIVANRTKTQTIYDFCMRVIQFGDEESIINAIEPKDDQLGLQKTFDISMRLKS